MTAMYNSNDIRQIADYIQMAFLGSKVDVEVKTSTLLPDYITISCDVSGVKAFINIWEGRDYPLTFIADRLIDGIKIERIKEVSDEQRDVEEE